MLCLGDIVWFSLGFRFNFDAFVCDCYGFWMRVFVWFWCVTFVFGLFILDWFVLLFCMCFDLLLECCLCEFCLVIERFGFMLVDGWFKSVFDCWFDCSVRFLGLGFEFVGWIGYNCVLDLLVVFSCWLRCLIVLVVFVFYNLDFCFLLVYLVFICMLIWFCVLLGWLLRLDCGLFAFLVCYWF